MDYTSTERFWLWVIAAIGLFGLNGVFLWAAVARPDMMLAALTNPVSLVFVIEALGMVGLLAYLLVRWRVSQVHWLWFVVLALGGSLAFALPVALLWGAPGRQAGGDARASGRM